MHHILGHAVPDLAYSAALDTSPAAACIEMVDGCLLGRGRPAARLDCLVGLEGRPLAASRLVLVNRNVVEETTRYREVPR